MSLFHIDREAFFRWLLDSLRRVVAERHRRRSLGLGRQVRQSVELVRVFATTEMARCAFVKSLLDGEAIEYLVKNETLKNVLGWAPTGWMDRWPAEFWVRSEDAERARALLRELDEQSTGKKE